MTPNETKNLSWKDAWWYLLNGKKIKRPLWDGYWVWENNTIMMHCRDGSVADIRGTEFPAYTFSNIAQRDWMVVEDGDNHEDDTISRAAAIDLHITNCPYFLGKNTIDRSVYGTHIGACSLEYHYEKICPSPKCLCAERLGLKNG